MVAQKEEWALETEDKEWAVIISAIWSPHLRWGVRESEAHPSDTGLSGKCTVEIGYRHLVDL